MKNLVLKLLPLTFLFAPLACGGGSGSGESEAGMEAEQEDPNAAKIGTFDSGDARLVVDDIERGPMGLDLEFQFSYENEESAGTMFGEADQKGLDRFEWEYSESNAKHRIDFQFKDGAWVVEHKVEDVKGSEPFLYTGTYTRTEEPEYDGPDAGE